MSSGSITATTAEYASRTDLRTLDQCKKGELLRLEALVAQPAFGDLDDEVTMRLKELGFLPGATFSILGFGFLGRDPLSVKVAGTKFALRRREASKLLVSKVENEL